MLLAFFANIDIQGQSCCSQSRSTNSASDCYVIVILRRVLRHGTLTYSTPTYSIYFILFHVRYADGINVGDSRKSGPEPANTSPPRGRRSFATSFSVYLSVCPLAYLKSIISKLHRIVCVCCLSQLGPLTTAKELCTSGFVDDVMLSPHGCVAWY